MGIYLNPDNILYKRSLNSKIYIDKSRLIEYTNQVLDTEQEFICVSRPRRFGKSMAAQMLAAYYSKGCLRIWKLLPALVMKNILINMM